MIIKEITIKNFRSYYGENKFEFTNGLTLVIGNNGDGKTTFFDALQWLFNTAVENNSIDNVSEMRKSKLEIGESDELLVSMLFEHDGEKLIEKRYTFERTSETGFKSSTIGFRGWVMNGAEREVVNGKNLMDRCFDAFIQRFSMFKGESTLNVFDNPAALKELVDKFSDIRKFDELVSLVSDMEYKSNRAYLQECKNDKKIAGEAKSLEFQLNHVSEEIQKKKKEIKDKQMSVTTFATRLEELEKNQETTERYKEVSDRLKNLNDKAIKKRSMLYAVDKNTALLDNLWILCAFPKIFNDFKSKSSGFSKEKRKQNDDFIKQKAIEQGKLEAIDEIYETLEGGVSKLPWYSPDEESMVEMINDHICKVCGRPAPEGSEAYNFMVKKLEEYKAHTAAKRKAEQDKEALEKKELFSGKYVEEIHHLSIRLSGSKEEEVANIKTEIADRLALEDRIKEDLAELEAKIQDAEDDKARLLIQAGNVSEDMLQKTFTDIKGMFEQKGRAEKRLVELEGELTDLKIQEADLQKKFDDLNPQSGQVRVYRDVHHVLDAIFKAFKNAKNENLRRFLGALEDKANEYLSKLSANDFHGEIRLRQTADDSTEIRLFSSNSTEIKNPSGSQETVMYMSVLFAISDFSDEKRDENYPLIFDAATSSFGDSKEEEFYNVIDKLNKQCIIVTKDFITKDQLRLEEIDQLTCGVYRIRKAPNFDDRNLATIRTLVEKIK
jgi:DNA sulfur modification protein DndD